MRRSPQFESGGGPSFRPVLRRASSLPGRGTDRFGRHCRTVSGAYQFGRHCHLARFDKASSRRLGTGWATLRPMSFSEEDLASLDRAEEVEIETQAPGKAARRTVIWVVVDGGEVFIRTFKGPDSRWYRDAMANPAVAIHVDGRRLPAQVRQRPLGAGDGRARRARDDSPARAGLTATRGPDVFRRIQASAAGHRSRRDRGVAGVVRPARRAGG